MGTRTALVPNQSEARRLLRQPGGFEGFLLGLVKGEFGHLVVTKPDQPGASSLNFDSFSSSEVTDVLHNKGVGFDLHRVFKLEADLIKGPGELLPESSDFGNSPINAGERPWEADQSKTASGAQVSMPAS
jgi:hypothetical protein